MHKRSLVLFLLLLIAAAYPARAHATLRLGADITRDVVGYGRIHAAGDSSPTDCTSSQSNPGATNANVNAGSTQSCGSFNTLAYEACTSQTNPDGSSSACDITLSAQVVDSSGWRFDHWSGDCTGTATTCKLATDETECITGGHPPCDTMNEGPYDVVAHFVDTRAPTTSYSQAPSQNSVVFSDTQTQQFTWSTNEDDEGPAFGCKRDTGAFSGCSSGFTWSSIADGVHDFCVHGTDASGLQGSDVCRHWEQETNPTASISTHPAATTGTPGAAFTYTSNKAGRTDGSTVSYQCKLDSGTFASCPASGQAYSLLANGQHTFQVQSVFTPAFGGAAHTSTAATFTWTQADTTGPSIMLASSPDGTVNLTDAQGATVSWTGTEPDENQTFECKLDNDPNDFQPCTSPVSLSNLADGIHDFRIRGKDFLGNVGPVTDVHWDQEVPATAAFTGGPAEGADLGSAHASFTFSTTKAGATFECALDGGSFAPCASPDGVDVTGDGSHTFSVRATFTSALDGSSHTGDAVTRTWTVDTTPPDTTIAGGPANGLASTDTGATFQFSASEPGGFECSLDGGPAAACTSPVTLSGLGVGQHTFSVMAVDAAGNPDPSPATRTWQVIAGGAAVVDADHDGYPASIDCNDANAAIHPGAVDVAGNGVDENCDGHDAAVPPTPGVGATVSASWKFFKTYTKLSSLSAVSVPAGAKVKVTCKGKKTSCKFKSKTVKASKARKVSLTKYFKKAKLAKNTKITITVTKPGTVGIKVLYTTRNGKLPKKKQSSIT